jgi:uncharacterized membrane protein
LDKDKDDSDLEKGKEKSTDSTEPLNEKTCSISRILIPVIMTSIGIALLVLFVKYNEEIIEIFSNYVDWTKENVFGGILVFIVF